MTLKISSCGIVELSPDSLFCSECEQLEHKTIIKIPKNRIHRNASNDFLVTLFFIIHEICYNVCGTLT